MGKTFINTLTHTLAHTLTHPFADTLTHTLAHTYQYVPQARTLLTLLAGNPAAQAALLEARVERLELRGADVTPLGLATVLGADAVADVLRDFGAQESEAQEVLQVRTLSVSRYRVGFFGVTRTRGAVGAGAAVGGPGGATGTHAVMMPSPGGGQQLEVRGPRGAEVRGPGGAEVRGPRGAEVRGPRGAEVRGPRGADVRGPRGAEVRGPRGAEVRGPRGVCADALGSGLLLCGWELRTAGRSHRCHSVFGWPAGRSHGCHSVLGWPAGRSHRCHSVLGWPAARSECVCST
eukprot:360999-Chlamydomonas_euryale.AAC.7